MGSARKKPSSLEAQLAALKTVTAAPASGEAREAIRRALAGGPSLVAARAARLVREHALEGLGDDLVAAFRRFLADAVKSDPGCAAKLAALEALDYGGHDDAAPFLEATRHVQKEPAFGPPVDTAAGVRARGVLALSRLAHPDLPLCAGALLADPEGPVRQAAADSLVAAGDRSLAGLLLLRWSAGDEEPLVILACMAGVLALASDQALPRLHAALFGGDGEPRELAALALGQSGRDDALDLLLEQLREAPRALERAPALRALGLHRSERALEAALDVIAGGAVADAEAALAGLGARRFERGLPDRVRAAVRKNGDPRLAAALAAAFPSGED
jgi:hypothetical protein